MIELRFCSELAAPAEAVWRRVSTMAGVNAELGPWLRMSHPLEHSDLLAQPVPLGSVLFHSWVLLLGIVPLDRHALCLEQLHARGFDERSTSWLQKEWIHRRRIEQTGNGTRVTDHLRFQPRLAPLAPLLRIIVSATFRHRHRQLTQQFGKTRA